MVNRAPAKAFGLPHDRRGVGPRSHDLRDALTVNGVAFAFHTKDSEAGRQLEGTPGVPDSAAGADPTRRDRAAATVDGGMATSHGIEIRPTAPLYDLVVLGAGPAGLAAAVYGASEGLERWSSRLGPSVVRRAPPP